MTVSENGWRPRLSRDKAAELTRATDGYALSLDAEIANLSPGEAIDDLPRDQKFARRTDDAWNRLAPELRHHARRLCVLADPLPSDRTPEFLGIDATEWGEAQELLREARIFSVEVNGLPWFHEKRRHYLIETKLDASERSALRREAWRWFDRELFAVLEGSSYGALYALEQRDWQPLLFEWIHLMTFLDRTKGHRPARMYLKALWWWGLPPVRPVRRARGAGCPRGGARRLRRDRAGPGRRRHRTAAQVFLTRGSALPGRR